MNKKKEAEDITIEPEQAADQPEQEATEESTEKQPINLPDSPGCASLLEDPDIKLYIDGQIQEGIQKALQGKTPKANIADPTSAERTAFQKMSYKERLKLYNSNPQAYQKLAKGSS